MNSPLEEMRLNLSSLLESCHRSAWYLLASSNSLNWPLDEKDLSEREMDLAFYERLAAINERFGKLQDLLSTSMRNLCLLAGENADTFLRVLSFCAKQGIVGSIEDWQLCRSLRNRAAHDYGADHSITAEHFNTLHDWIPNLVSVTFRLTDYADKNLGVRAKDDTFLKALAALK
jgi:hypothetical protein